MGAALFTVGLFSACTFGPALFTGRLCYVLEKGRAYAAGLPLIWLGNLAGTGIMAALAAFSRMGGIRERAAELCSVKMGDSLLSLFLLGLLVITLGNCAGGLGFRSLHRFAAMKGDRR